MNAQQFQAAIRGWVLARVEETPGYSSFLAIFRPLTGAPGRFLVVRFSAGFPQSVEIEVAA